MFLIIIKYRRYKNIF